MLTFYISPTFYRFVPHLLTLGGAYLAYFLYFTYFLPLCSPFAYSGRCLSCLLSIFHLLFTALFPICLFWAVPISLTLYISPTFYRFVPHLLILGGAYLAYFLYFTYFLPLCSSFAYSRRFLLAYFLYFTYFLPLCSSFAYSRRYFYNLIPVTNILPSLSLKFENVAQTCAIRDL